MSFRLSCFHFGAAAASLLALIFERPAAGIVKEKILGRDEAQRPDEIVLEQRDAIEPAEKGIVRQQGIGDVFAAKSDTSNPAEMVEADILAMNLIRRGSERGVDAVQHLGGRIADADHLGVAVVLDGLGDQAGRVGEIDQPGLRAQPFHQLRLFDGDGDGAQRHGDAAGAGGLLAGIAVGDDGALIVGTGLGAADADAVEHKIGAFDGILDGGCLTYPQPNPSRGPRRRGQARP